MKESNETLVVVFRAGTKLNQVGCIGTKFKKALSYFLQKQGQPP